MGRRLREGPEPVPDIKFSCGQCGQHISCDEAWSGHQIQCPACQNTVLVPEYKPAAAPASANPVAGVAASSASSRPKLSAGATQVTRPTQPSAPPQRRLTPRPPKATNPAIKYAVIAVLLLAVGLLGIKYVPGLINQAQEAGTPNPTTSGGAPASGGGGPLGEVNGAMDVSDTLDGGSSSRPRARPGRRATVPPPGGFTNSASKQTNNAARGR